MKKKPFLFLLVSLCSITLWAQTTITVSNPTALQRSELVSISAAQLGVEAGKAIVVRDAFGIERTTQWTHDGQLLLPVHVRPNSKATFTMVEGTPAAVISSVGGAMYPSRLEDVAFENDRIGIRLYGPALQRKGEKGYGHDLWVKRTTELILPELYSNDPRLSFHLDYGKGLDCYAVGQSLGCGTPCMLRDDKIVYPWCYETYLILEKGPLRFAVQVDFPAVDDITEHRLLSLDKGSNFFEATVLYCGLPQPTDIATALAIRDSDPTSVVIGDGYVHYADPTIDPARHQTQIFVALLFPDETVTIRQQEKHALGILKNCTADRRFHYFFGAAWSEFDVRSQGEWNLRIQDFMQAQKHPLTVTIQ